MTSLKTAAKETIYEKLSLNILFRVQPPYCVCTPVYLPFLNNYPTNLIPSELQLSKPGIFLFAGCQSPYAKLRITEFAKSK